MTNVFWYDNVVISYDHQLVCFINFYALTPFCFLCEVWQACQCVWIQSLITHHTLVHRLSIKTELVLSIVSLEMHL